MTRREWLAAGGLGALALGLPRPLRAVTTGPAIGQVAVLSTRPAEIVRWSPYKPRGVALFSHDAGSRPQAHPVLMELLGDAGFAVLAPVHVDAAHREASFPARIEDMFAAATEAAQLYDGLPMIAAGQGYGALVAMCLGGAVDRRLSIPAVAAALALDPSARFDGMIDANDYRTLAVPLMSVSGVAEVGKGGDPLLAARTARSGSFGIAIADSEGDAAARFTRAAPAIALFVEGYGLGRGSARRRLRRWVPAQGDAFTVRPPA